jgi:hypothetical protein
MRKMLIGLAATALVASSAFAGGASVYDRTITTITATSTNAATAVVGTETGIRGAIEEIFIDLSTATTATVTIAVSPEDSTMTGYNLFSGGVSSDTILRPRFDGTDADGVALSSEVWLPILIGDSLVITCSGFDATNKVVKVTTKYSK